MRIKQDLLSYGEESKYNFDNKIIMDWYPSRVVEKIKKHFPERHGSLSCLELGLGYGYATEYFETEGQFMHHTVLDGDAAIIKKYISKHKNIKAEIVETYFENYDTENKYDIIIMGFILEHVDDPVAILEKYKRFLTPDGVIFIAVPNSESLHRRVGNVAGLLKDTKALSEEDIKYGHKRYYDIDLIKEHCEKADCSIKSIEGIFLKSITTGQMISLDLKPEVIDAFCEVGVDYPELCDALLVEVN